MATKGKGGGRRPRARQGEMPAEPPRTQVAGRARPGHRSVVPALPAGDGGRRRVVIEAVSPEIDGGRHAAKAVLGDSVAVAAEVYADGHDLLRVVCRYRHGEEAEWREVALAPGVNDRWSGRFPVTGLGPWRFTLVAWVDRFGTWRRDLERRRAASVVTAADLALGAGLVDAAAARAEGDDARDLARVATRLRGRGRLEGRVATALEDGLAERVARHAERAHAVTYEQELAVWVDPVRARFSAWYELFPRSASPDPSRPGTLKDVEARLPYVARLGFDTLYLPPIHPIGQAKRKGPNNRTEAAPGDPGSPWAIGSAEGGHLAVNPGLGTLDDLRHLVARARDHFGIEVALDVAFQCAPDHPWVKAHPSWFAHRPDGSIQYAENPPKKYEDIVPFDFESADWQDLWQALLGVFEHWIAVGVKTFRVDNPHTKSLRFWAWCLDAVKRRHPEVVFLAEAFTRPRLMYGLAKIGFTQSYTYFAWKNAKWELMQWFTETLRPEIQAVYRPNLWPNTPDILNAYLQHGGRGAFMARLVLAATLGASYGIYGPAFELMADAPREPGSEEYLDSEKYQVRHWDLARADSLAPLITRINHIRRENAALHAYTGFAFHPVDNDQLLCFSKHTEDLSNVIVVVVNLDPHHRQSGWVTLPLSDLGIPGDRPYQVHDLIGDARYLWSGDTNYVALDPAVMPAHVFRVRRHLRTERDFDYYL